MTTFTRYQVKSRKSFSIAARLVRCQRCGENFVNIREAREGIPCPHCIEEEIRCFMQ